MLEFGIPPSFLFLPSSCLSLLIAGKLKNVIRFNINSVTVVMSAVLLTELSDFKSCSFRKEVAHSVISSRSPKYETETLKHSSRKHGSGICATYVLVTK